MEIINKKNQIWDKNRKWVSSRGVHQSLLKTLASNKTVIAKKEKTLLYALCMSGQYNTSCIMKHRAS